MFAPLVVWAFWIGLSPQPYFRILDRSVATIVERVHPGYYDMSGKRARMAQGSPNPFVNTKDFPAYIETVKKEFEASLAEQTAAAQAK